MIRLDLVRQDLDTLRYAARLANADRARTGEPPLSPAARRWLQARIKELEGFLASMGVDGP